MYIFYGLVPVLLFAFWCVHFALARYFETKTHIDTLLQQIDAVKKQLATQQRDLRRDTAIRAALGAIERELMNLTVSKNVLARERSCEKLQRKMAKIQACVETGASEWR